MSQHLALWEPGGTSFPLRETPSVITWEVLDHDGTGQRAAKYMQWLEGETDVHDWREHAAELIDWLLAHPDHSWVAT